MEKPANQYIPVEEFFCRQRDSTFIPEILDKPLVERAEMVVYSKLIEVQDG